jgi:MFS transporter, OFA family, oxalate/formate antiporter
MVGQGSDHNGAVLDVHYYWFCDCCRFYIVLVHVVAYAIDTGIKPTDAALILTFANVGLIAAQFLVWVLTKRLSSRFTIMMLLALQALALFLLIGASGFTILIVLGTVYGFGFGGSNTVRLSMVSEIFGTHSAGAIIGLITVAWAAGGMFGPILAGYIFDLSHSYDIAFLVGGLLLTTGAASGFFLKAPGR